VKYAALLTNNADDVAARERLTPEEAAAARAEEIPKWNACFEELGKADPELSGFELEAASDAKVVRVRDGQRLVTDGPFAETKELIGGVFFTELPDLDEAIRLAALVPAAEYGSMEIRPLVEH